MPTATASLAADFADGLSNTVLCTEKYSSCSNASYVGGGNSWAYFYTCGNGLTAIPGKKCRGHWTPWGTVYTCGNMQAYHPVVGAPWSESSIGPASRFLTQPKPYAGNCDPTLASSPHASGINVVMADGSARHLTSRISNYTWWYMMTPKGGEVVAFD